MGYYELINQPHEDMYPLVNVYITMENHHAVNGKTHYFYCHVFNSKLFVYRINHSLIIHESSMKHHFLWVNEL